MANWFVNEGPKYVVLFLWMGINVLLFTLTYIQFDTEKRYIYLKELLKGKGLPVARGAAMVLNFNCMLILLPVCRNLISLVRSKCTCLPQNILRLLDKNITFHRVCAYMIAIATAIHVGAHMFNVENFVTSWQSTDKLVSTLNSESGDNFVNPIRNPDGDSVTEAIQTVAGVSGVIITMCLIIMVSSSTELIRRSYFEVFWFTHHLFIVFFIGLIIHGVQGIIHSQTNIEDHDPEVCKDKDWAATPACQKKPLFGAAGPQTWKWVVGPLALYLLERCLRFYRSTQNVEISKVVKHPSKVLEIQMKKPGFHAEPGQYIFLHCPNISNLEWHPFTLTSCPEEDFFSLHIRLVGDWTGALAKACDTTDVSSIPRVAVDGPFGTASTDVFNYPVCVCVGAGIGVTPFASILKSIWYKYQSSSPDLKVTKVYFFWICPDTNAFEWFTDLLQSLETQMEEKNLQGFLEYHIYLTRGWDNDQARNIAMHQGSQRDVITGLQQKMNFGRPNWAQIFKGIADNHPRTDIGVFFCGPAVLSHTLHKMSNMHNDDKTGTKFYYNKENF
ncbi:cytochrome b-245 heavy chain-like [Rhopilema esculentum]|uniref:cytochrome b-245 heavy chain-like n=1 Tax=Rhopilema esculentum TaxID=499914 RepID=UPI0031D99BDF|eukprot:gene17428-9031_t